MKNIESEIIAIDANDSLFDNMYISQDFVLLKTTLSSKELMMVVVNLLEEKQLAWLTPLQTRTSRQLFLGELGDIDSSLPSLIFKKARSSCHSFFNGSLEPVSPVDEVRASYLLSNIVQRLDYPGAIPVPNGFSFVSVKVEMPFGILVDKRQHDKYSIFIFEKGFDSGEILQYTDPPMEGVLNFNPDDWRTFCAVKDILNRITRVASREGLILQDYDVHQVLYRVNPQSQSLELILLDSERFKIIN